MTHFTIWFMLDCDYHMGKMYDESSEFPFDTDSLMASTTLHHGHPGVLGPKYSGPQ
jgi:hypothetical protein